MAWLIIISGLVWQALFSCLPGRGSFDPYHRCFSGGSVPGIHQMVREWLGAKETGAKSRLHTKLLFCFLVNSLCTWRAKWRISAFSKSPFKSLLNSGQRMERSVSLSLDSGKEKGPGCLLRRTSRMLTRIRYTSLSNGGTAAKILLETCLAKA